MKCQFCNRSPVSTNPCGDCGNIKEGLARFIKSPQGRLFVFKQLAEVGLRGFEKAGLSYITHHQFTLAENGDHGVGLPDYQDTINVFFTYGNPLDVAEDFHKEMEKLVRDMFLTEDDGALTSSMTKAPGG